MSAYEILQEMHAKYARMISYQDMGVVLTTWPNKTENNQICFTTAFRRPDRFRFEWSDHRPSAGVRHSRSVLWASSSGIYSNYLGEIETEQNLQLAIAGATGISNGSAHTVSAMLIPDFGFAVSDIIKLSLEQEIFEDIDCYRIIGRHPYDEIEDNYEVFIGVHDLLLRQVIGTDADGVITREIRREIQVDKSIRDEIFEGVRKP